MKLLTARKVAIMTRKVVKRALTVSTGPLKLSVNAGSLTLSRKSTTSMSSPEMQARIDQVKAVAMANVGTLKFQVDALKRSLPSDLPTVLAGRVKPRR